MRSSDATPVLIFDVDAAGVERPAASARCKLRVAELRDRRQPHPSAVLVLRALTRPRLRACVLALREGGGAIPPEVLCGLLAQARHGPEPPPDDLTLREVEVLRLLADGGSTRDIAERLSYSERTVKNIVRDLLTKLECRTRAQAAAVAVRHGVI
jgi:DNA-binding NarL/FixJ family response regulator